MDQPVKRIERLRQAALDKHIPSLISQENRLLWMRGYMAHAQQTHHLIRRALAARAVHEHATICIDADELIVGKPCHRTLTESEKKEWDDTRADQQKAMPQLQGQDSHMAIDYPMLLCLGLDGIKQKIHDARSRLRCANGEDLKKDVFYEAALIALDGVAIFSNRYAAHARALAKKQTDPVRTEELLQIADRCEKVPKNPANTFEEALQSMHFITFCMDGLYQVGRPDRTLYPYYLSDRDHGTLLPSRAQELIDCFCIMMNETVPRGLATGLMVGGRDESGADMCNELTRHFLTSILHTRLIYPGIGLCHTKDTPRDVTELAATCVSQGLSHPAFFNDDMIAKGLMRYGIPRAQAHEYIHSTCVEITPIDCSSVWVASPYINLTALLLDVLDSATKDQKDASALYPTQQKLESAFFERLQMELSSQMAHQNRLQMERAAHGGYPLVSCFVNDCIEKGVDIDHGGARIRWIMPSFVGLANCADSLTAIKRLVYDEKAVDLLTYTQAMRDNWSDQALHNAVKKVPKYGNDEQEADHTVKRITQTIDRLCAEQKTFFGDRCVPSLFCWEMHERLGAVTPATPDGRMSGFALGDGSGPAQGREQNGPTAAILSSTKWDHTPFIGGIAINMKFDPKVLSENGFEIFFALLATFMQRGGFEWQINAVDADTLKKAKEDPDRYRDLVVRIGGYSDYFVRLSDSMQDELIERTQFINS